MNLHSIKFDGKDFVLLPASCYKANKKQIDKYLSESSASDEDEYVPFKIEDYFTNPITIERIKNKLSQKQLAKLMNCSQSYVSQLENNDDVTPAVLKKIKQAIQKRTN